MIRGFWDYQRNMSELSRMSDRELADIGLDRSDIPRVAAGSYSRWLTNKIKSIDDARLAAGVFFSDKQNDTPVPISLRQKMT